MLCKARMSGEMVAGSGGDAGICSLARSRLKSAMSSAVI